MVVPEIHPREYQFCLILWEHEPIRSMELIKLCKEILSWSKSTTFTVIRNLSDRSVIQNQNGTVTSLFTKEQVQIARIDQAIEKYFDDSPAKMIVLLTQMKEELSSNG